MAHPTETLSTICRLNWNLEVLIFDFNFVMLFSTAVLPVIGDTLSQETRIIVIQADWSLAGWLLEG